MDTDINSLAFDWDTGNSGKNKRRHDVEDLECEEAFFDVNKVVLDDKPHSVIENRFVLLGKTKSGRLLYVAFTIRGDKLRVISARDIKKAKEIELYEKAAKHTGF